MRLDIRISSFYFLEGLMKNIIFLDIDGVLNDNYSEFLSESIEVLNLLVQIYNANVVMISSWQMNGTETRRKMLKYLLEQLCIYNIDFIDPNFEGNLGNIKLPSRLLGIVDYLKNNEITNYVILDDEYHNDYKLIRLNYFKTMPFNGLTYKDLSKIVLKPVNINNFKNINYQYRQLKNYEVVTNNLIKVLKKKYENDLK